MYCVVCCEKKLDYTSVECRVSSVECRVSSVECRVSSVEIIWANSALSSTFSV